MPVSAPPKNKPGGLAVLAEIEAIEPKLKKHRQEFAPTFSASVSDIFPAIFSQLGIKSAPSQQVSQTLATQTVSLSLENIGKVQSTPQLQQLVTDAATQSIIDQKEIARGKTAAQIYEKAQTPASQVVQENQKGLEEEAILANIAQIASLQKPDQETAAIIRNEVESAAESEDPLMPPEELDKLISSVETHLERSRENLNAQLANITLENLPSLEKFQEIKQKAFDEAIAQLQDQTQTKVNLNQLTSDISTELGIKPLAPDQVDRFGLGFAQPTTSTFRANDLEGRRTGIVLSTNEKAQEEAVLSILSYDKEKVENGRHRADHAQFFYERLNNFSSKNPKKAERYLNHFQKLKGGLNEASRTSRRTFRAYSGRFPGIYVPQNILSPQVLVNANIGALSSQYGNFSVGNVVSGARGLGSGLKGAIGFGKGVQGAIMAGKLVFGASNPAGWAMLAAQFARPIIRLAKWAGKWGKRLAIASAGLGILLLLILLKLLSKLAAIAAGAATGAAIGFIVGGPIGALIGGLIGAGVGWIVSNWAVPVTNFVGGVFSGLGSAASSVGLAINSFGSAIASGAGSFFSGFLGALGGFSNITLSLGSITVPASVIFIPVGGAVAAIVVNTLFIGTLTGAAFFSAAGAISNIVPGQNNFFSISKIPSPDHFENLSGDQTQQETFTITLTAKTALTNIEITDDMKLLSKSGTSSIDTDAGGKSFASINCPKNLDPNTSCVQRITINIKSNYNDSLITNTVKVKATPPGQNEVQDTTSAIVTVGNPPLPNCGQSSSFSTLLPNPIPQSVNPVSPGSFATLISGDVVNVAKIASAQTGVPCEMLVGIHYVEAGWSDKGSFISGRPIGAVETDIGEALYCTGLGGTFSGGGCVFSSLQQTAVASANIVLNKMQALTGQRKPPANFEEMIGAMELYNGPGNANCKASVPYNGPCPPPRGTDNPYALGHFDIAHKDMFLIYCGDNDPCKVLTPFISDGAATAAKEFFLKIGGH